MSIYIDADALKKTILEHDYLIVDSINSKDRGMFTVGIMQAINEQPTADVRENVRGEWIKGGEQPYFRKHFDIVVCSKCNKRGEHRWKFCPNCGADMRGEEHETD